MRRTMLAVGLVAAAALGGCKKSQPPAEDKGAKAGEAKAGEAKAGEGGAEGQAGEPGGVAQRADKAAGAGCSVPAAVDHDFTLKKGCEVRTEESISVTNGATLTIEAGAKLRFAPNTDLEVGEGRLIVQGTEKEPVLFSSISKSPAAGDWPGIVFNGNAANGSVIDHAIIEYAGHNSSWGVSTLLITGTQSPGRISVTNTVFQKCAEVAVRNESARFGKFEGNTLKEVPLAMDVEAEVLGSVGANTFGAPIKVAGTLTSPATWPKTDQPFLVGELRLAGKSESAVLTLPEKAVLKFSDGGGLVVGEEAGGGLVARDVTFTSAAKEPNPADWAGFTFLDKASVLTLEGGTVAYAGKGNPWGEGVVRFEGDHLLANKRVSLKNVNFTKAGGPMVIRTAEPKDCQANFAAPALALKADGAPLCAKVE